MITHLDIPNFGSFQGLSWQRSCRDSGNSVQKFKRLNVIYGRNYSGKTTLSRIFRALETSRLPPNLDLPVFTVYGEKGNVSQLDIAGHAYDVRVYNRDFVTDNLSFLVNEADGEIKTFAIVGEKNKEIDDEISAIEAELGSVETKNGLRFELDGLRLERDRTDSNHKTASTSLEGKLRDHANNSIKTNREYGKAVYNIDAIKRDISATKKSGFKPLSTVERSSSLLLLKQEMLSDISGTVIVELKIDSIRRSAELVLGKSIAPTQPIQELLNDSVLQLWVRQGIPLHREKREECAFCRQKLPHDIWQTLDAHFSQESSDLEIAIDRSLKEISTEVDGIADFVTLTGDMFYPEEKAEFALAKKSLDDELATYTADLKALRTALEKRKIDLFKTVAIPALSHKLKLIQKHTSTINDLVRRNNDRTETLDVRKIAAREALRLSDVADFINTISYETELIRIAELKDAAVVALTTYAQASQEITNRETRIVRLLGQQKDERKGAERVNSLLNHFFGHDGIKLEAKENADKTTVKFEIVRDGLSARNLSEGECSLIAFCYFIARLEEPESQGKDLIIYIDDPISSLDSNHIFFMFSLIESLIARPTKNTDGSNKYRYGQLFISTHNLDFLNYLRRISVPRKKVPAGDGKFKSVADHEQFIIERLRTSNLALMPAYLRNYITEFNYLFHQIYKCRNPLVAAELHDPFYCFGNNLRKFLEAFLFFKYPHHDDQNDALERIRKFFGEEEETAVALVNRLDNEFSHLQSSPDRSFKPIDIPEISKVANFVLDKIYKADPQQYNALLKSIGEAERTPEAVNAGVDQSEATVVGRLRSTPEQSTASNPP